MKKKCPICLKKFDYDAEYGGKYDPDLCKKCDDKENEKLKTYLFLAECGVPFSHDGTPLGIGWD